MPTTCAFNSDPIATPAANKVTLAGEEGLTDSRADRKELRAACAPSSSARRRRYLPSNPRGVLSSPSRGAMRSQPRQRAAGQAGSMRRAGCPRPAPRKGGGSSAVTGDAALRRWPRAGGSGPSAPLPGRNSRTASPAGPSAPSRARVAPRHAPSRRVKQGLVPFRDRTQPGLWSSFPVPSPPRSPPSAAPSRITLAGVKPQSTPRRGCWQGSAGPELPSPPLGC